MVMVVIHSEFIYFHSLGFHLHLLGFILKKVLLKITQTSGLQLNLLKRDSNIPVKFAKFLRTPTLKNIWEQKFPGWEYQQCSRHEHIVTQSSTKSYKVWRNKKKRWF